MSVRELKRVEVLGRVKAGDVTLRQASELLAISYRHAKRLWKRFRRRGAVGLYLLWSDPSVDLHLYLTSASCNDFPQASCTILAKSVGEIGTSEQITFVARAGEHYRVWVDNFSAQAQTFWLSYTTTQGVTLSAGDAGLERSSGAVYSGQKPAGARKIR